MSELSDSRDMGSRHAASAGEGTREAGDGFRSQSRACARAHHGLSDDEFTKADQSRRVAELQAALAGHRARDGLFAELEVYDSELETPEFVPKADRPKCGAKRRAGGRCEARAVWDPEANAPRNGRCRLHGGLSTGPKTPEGKAAVVAALRRRQVPPRPRRVRAPICGARRVTGDRCRAFAVLDPRTQMPHNGRCAAHGGLEGLEVATAAAARREGERARGTRL